MAEDLLLAGTRNERPVIKASKSSWSIGLGSLWLRAYVQEDIKILTKAMIDMKYVHNSAGNYSIGIVN